MSEEKEWYGYSKYFDRMRAGTDGSFAKSLADAWYNASDNNRRKLVEAFPEIFVSNYCYHS